MAKNTGFKEWTIKRYGSVKEYKRLRALIAKRDMHRCQYCRRKLKMCEYSLHHIIQEGTNDLENLILLCSQCHDILEGISMTADEIRAGIIKEGMNGYDEYND